MNHYTVKELPVSEKPYEKFLINGPAFLSDAELLAVILRTGSQGIRSVELAEEILRQKDGGLLNLFDLSFSELREIKGIGTVKAIQMKCLAEISRRISKTDQSKRISLTSAATVADYYMEELRHEKRERLLLSMFDFKCNLIGDEVISIGTMNASLVSPREIFFTALDHHAAYIILLHNHPSGNPRPSIEDFTVTKRVAECGELLGIRLYDHIIIGDHQYYSFNEEGHLGRAKGEQQ